MGPLARKLLLHYMIINDAMAMHDCGMNHNASDRACIYDTWLEWVKSPTGLKHFAEEKAKYDRHHPDLKTLQDATGYQSQEFPTEETDTYALEVVEEALPMLEKKL